MTYFNEKNKNLIKNIKLSLTFIIIFSSLIILCGCGGMKSKESYKKGSKLLKEKKYVEATEEFYKTIKTNPRNIKGYIALADSMMIASMNKENQPKLIKIIAKSKKIKNNNITSSNMKAVIDDEVYSLLIKAKNLAKKKDPNSELPYIGIGKFYLNKGMTEKAKEQFLIALKKNPNNPKADYYLATIYVANKKYKKAYKIFKKLINLDPKKNEENYNAVNISYSALTELIALLQKYDNESLNIVKKAVKRAPNYSRGYSVLGIINYKNGHIDEAIKDFKKALEKSPKQEAFTHKLLGKIYEKKNENKKAIKEYKAFLEFYGKDGRDKIPYSYEAQVKAFSGIDPDYRDLKSVRNKVKELQEK